MGKEKPGPSLIKWNCWRIVHAQQVFKRSLQKGSVFIKERTALSSSEALQPCPRRVYFVLVLPLLRWLSPVLQRQRSCHCSAVVQCWVWRELKKKKKISDPKMKEKVLQVLGTALNHCSRSCGKRPVGRAVLSLLRMDVGKLRKSKACFWVLPSKQLMIYGSSYVLHLSTERLYFLLVSPLQTPCFPWKRYIT